MPSFSDMFDMLDPGPRKRHNELLELLKQQASDISGVPADRLGNVKPGGITVEDIEKLYQATGGNIKTKTFRCFNCNVLLETSKKSTHCECPKCHYNNQLYDVSGPITSPIDTVETKAKPVSYQSGKTTDDDDIIDIAFEPVQ